MDDDLGNSAATLAEAGVYLARAWGTRESVGRGRICACNADRDQCRVGLAGRHPVHADPARTATRDPSILEGWRTAFASENMLALTGARSRLVGLSFQDREALHVTQRRFGALPFTPLSEAPGGSRTAWFRWARPPVIDPDGMGTNVRVHAEGARLLVPGSTLADGVAEWVVSPADARIAGLPLPWRQTILNAADRRVFRTA